MFNRFAARLAESPRQRHLFFLVAALTTIVVAGYHFGTFDQAIHIPFLKKNAQPELFPNDPFFEMRFQHYSYFWYFFLPFYHAGILEIVMFVVHIFATYLTYWALWSLSMLLFNRPLTALWGLLAVVIPPIGFGGFPLFEFSLLNRTFVLPFLLWAIIWYLQRRYVLAFSLLGLLFNLHVISVNFVMAMLMFDSLLRWQTLGWRRLIQNMGVFVLFALPVLQWRAGAPLTGLDPTDEWFWIVSRGMLYHLYFPVSTYLHVILPTINGVCAMLFFWLARRQPLTGYDRSVTHFLYAVIIIIVVQIIAGLVFPMTLLMQLQIVRAGLFALVFGYLYLAHYLVTRYEAGELSMIDFRWLAAATVFSPLPMVPFGILVIQRWRTSVRLRYALVSLLLLGFGAVGLQYNAEQELWRPGIYIYGPQNDWKETQLWARDNSALEARFVTPPHLWGVHDSEWRVFSERSTVVTLSELLEVALVPDYVETWKTRFERLAPGALEQFAGHYFENVDLTRNAFYNLSTAELLAVAEDFGATYLVVEQPYQHDLPLVFENEGFRIYDLRSLVEVESPLPEEVLVPVN